MNKYILLGLILFFAVSSCKDDCTDDELNANCQGMHEYRDGACQCPENSVDMGQYFCKEYSQNSFWIQEGDPCLGKAYFFFGQSSTDIFDPEQSTIYIEWTQGISGHITGGFRKINKIGTQYYEVKITEITRAEDDLFKECLGGEIYDGYDLEIKIDLDWSTADATYKFWNDLDTTSHIKKDFGTELKAVFMSNTGPK